MMENKPASLKLMMTLGLVAMGQRAFMNRTVGEILWGYEDPFVSFLNKYFPDMFPMKDKFGLFVGVSVLCPCRESGCLLRKYITYILNLSIADIWCKLCLCCRIFSSSPARSTTHTSILLTKYVCEH